ncbi:MAG: hypothetical protein ACXW0I_05935 [Methylosarcina sp.]
MAVGNEEGHQEKLSPGEELQNEVNNKKNVNSGWCSSESWQR